MLSRLKTLIPGTDAWPRFERNRSEQFEGRSVVVRINANSSPWLDGMAGSALPIAVAHGEGRAEFRDPEPQAVLQYVDGLNEATETYSMNPNGSHNALAGTTSADGRAPQQGLTLANDLVAERHWTFTFQEVEKRLGKTKTAPANLLKRMENAGLIGRVRGHYAVRQLGVLGTPTAAEDVTLSVGAALKGLPHRIAYRSALYEHDLLVHPGRSIQVANVGCAPRRSPAARCKS